MLMMSLDTTRKGEKAKEKMSSVTTKNEVCRVCDKIGTYACPICDGPMYCGEKHQEIDWSRHHAKCNVVHTNDPATSVFMPFDLIDAQGLPVTLRMMECATDNQGTQYCAVHESKIGDANTMSIEARRFGGEKVPRNTPVLARPGLTSGIGPQEGVGAGRAPTAEERDNGNGIVTLTIEFWRSYTDKTKDRPADGKWIVSTSVTDEHLIYHSNPNERIRRIADLRADREREGLVVWFSEDALDQLRQFELPTSGGYIQFSVAQSWNNRERSTNAVYGNLRYLRQSFMKSIKRWFGSGFTARGQLQAKGLQPQNDYILYMHDKRMGSGVRIQLTVRTGNTKGMRIVDIEVFLPDAQGLTTEDSALDSNSAMITLPLACDIRKQEHVDGLVCALKQDLAFLEDTSAELVRTPMPDAETNEMLRIVSKSARNVSGWLNVIEPHAARLQRDGNAFVGASYDDDYTQLHEAVNAASAYLVNEKRSGFRGLLGKAKDKIAQRQYESKIKSEGPEWALDKLGDADWQQDPGRLQNLKKALLRQARIGKGRDRARLDEALRLVDRYLGVQDTGAASSSTNGPDPIG